MSSSSSSSSSDVVLCAIPAIPAQILGIMVIRVLLSLLIVGSLVVSANAWRSFHFRAPKSVSSLAMSNHQLHPNKVAASALVAMFGMFGVPQMQFVQPAVADPSKGGDQGANDKSNTKIRKGGASTLQQGITKSITRGVNLDGTDFSGQNLKGVAFQQSIVRNADFRGSNLYSASFFDATLDNTDFEGADLTLANVELAQFKGANFKNVVAREMYVVGTTLFEGIASIENSDWTDTELRKDQTKYLCSLPSAKGTNPTTGADTRESLRCQD